MGEPALRATGFGARLRQAVVCFALSGAMVLACGNSKNSGETPNDTAGGPIETLEDLQHELAASRCRGECAETAGLVLERIYGGECLEISLAIYEVNLAQAAHSLGAGRMIFDAVAAQRCIDSRAAGQCEEAQAACDDAFVGQLRAGEACADSTECAGNAFCATSTLLECPGACMAYRVLGESCRGDLDRCAEGLACSADGVCFAPKADAEPCDSDSECESYSCGPAEDGDRCLPEPDEPALNRGVGEACTRDTDCELDLYCAEGACAPAAKLGEPCGAGVSCVLDSYCLVESGADQGVCGERIAQGRACDDSAACATGICDGGTCEKFSTLGQPCVTDERCFGVCEGGVCGWYAPCTLD